MNRWLLAWLVSALVLAMPAAAPAQQGSPQADQPPQAQPKAKKRTRAPPPELDEADQLSPRQLDERPPARPARPARSQPPADADPAAPAAAAPAPAAAAPAPRGGEGPRTIACNGVFGKESSHLKLATRYDSRNITFTEVDGPEGSKLMASVLFPNDPKRRLEVLWNNEGSRTDTHLIVINGQSTWTGPKGLRLGLPLAALEKANGKPFKMSGFDQPNGGSVSDWDGGALDKLPGGCKVGVRLAPDVKATEAARSEVLGKEFASNDGKMHAVKPIVAEIIFGY
jgi:hypothetical protein